jgi:hypothetical protein
LDEAKKEAIRRFLREFKHIATNGRGIDIVDRVKNMQALARLGLTKRNCREEILSLSVEDYCDGPKPDKDRPGEVWEFGKLMGGKDIYIKLKISHVGRVKLAKCISFHEAERALCFPFGRDSEEGREKK